MTFRANELDKDRRHERNHARNLQRGFPHEKRRYPEKCGASNTALFSHF
jgi:hypothetical protein